LKKIKKKFFLSLALIFGAVIQHQKVQQKIIDLQNKIRERDREILQLAALLHGAERQLEKITEGARSKLDAVKQANTNRMHPSSTNASTRLKNRFFCLAVDLDTLVEYAYRITYNTGKMPGIREFSPYPPDGAIQASRLMSGTPFPCLLEGSYFEKYIHLFYEI
jgi:hypothetical protein